MNEKELKTSEVRKNVFGLLSMFVFLTVVFLSSLLKYIFKSMPNCLNNVINFSYVGYAVAILLEIICLIISSKNKEIDMRAAGTNYGFVAMIFSIFMILVNMVYG